MIRVPRGASSVSVHPRRRKPCGGSFSTDSGASTTLTIYNYPRSALTHGSGLAVKKMIDVGAGVVDADYRGNVGVVLFNFGQDDFDVAVGDRIAQLILEQVSMVPAVQVEELTETERGAGGFGSTGVAGDANKKARTISPKNSEEAES